MAVMVVEGMHDAVCSTANTAAEGVVVTVVVVVTHFARRTAVDYCLRLVNLKRGRRRFLARSDGIGVELRGRRASTGRR